MEQLDALRAQVEALGDRWPTLEEQVASFEARHGRRLGDPDGQ
jgi:hypothetical protein